MGLPKIEIGRNQFFNFVQISTEVTQPLLIFLHEGLGCIAMWKDFPARLCHATGCPGLIYDRIGYGGSSPLRTAFSPDYMHQGARQELPSLLQRVLPRTPYILIGHSDGGSISLIYAADRPRNCIAAITIAAHVFVEPMTITGIRQAVLAWQKGTLQTRLAQYHGTKTENIFNAWSRIWLSDEFRSWNIEEILPPIDIPLLVIQGENDQYGSWRQVEAIAAGVSGPVQTAVIEACGHSPHRETPADLIRLITTFIGSMR